MATDLRFEVLGPVRAWNGDTELDLGSPQQRAVLAILLLSEGWQVSRDILVDAIWGADPPRAAAGAVRTYISRLRRCLGPVTGDRAADLLTSVGDGYAFATRAVTLDAELFTQQVRQAQLTRGRGEPARAASQLSEALGLWRGQPLAGIQGPYADSQRTRLLELRMAATEDRLALNLELGEHLAVIAELRALTDEYPLREKLSELLMLALYRAGRQADSLAVFGDSRRLLSDQLGVDPGPGLRDMHARILRADVSLTAGLAGPGGPGGPPGQLPLAPADLTGRELAVRSVVAALADSPAPPVIALTGMPGIGKTALGIAAAHAAAAAFPDGQLYAALGETETTPADPAEVLAGFLRALGSAARPGPPAELARALQVELAGHRVLVVLDGVRDAAQALPLLGALRGCAVILTSQRRMIDLPVTRWFEVDPLPPGEARHLFERLVGGARLAAEPAATERLVTTTAGQPVAIRAAAARLIARPGWAIEAMISQLEVELTLPVVSHADCELVEAPFKQAYGRLPADQALVFRRAALSDRSEVSVAEVAALTGLEENRVLRALDSLADAHLVQAAAFGRYRYAPIIKQYAWREGLAENGYPAGTAQASPELLGGLASGLLIR